MPDMERITDELRVHVAKTDDDKAYVLGFIAGKNRARKEVVAIFGLAMMIYLLIGIFQ